MATDYDTDEMPVVTIKPPKTMGACIDLLYKWEQERAVIARQVKEMQAKERALTNHIFDTFSKDDLNGAAGKVAKISIIRKDVPTPKDWPKIYTYIAKNKAWELLQKRLSSTAVKERWNAGKSIPGIDKFQVLSLSTTKLK